MRLDLDYARICRRFLDDPDELTNAFAHAWYKLTHRDVGPFTRYPGPPEQPLWHAPLPDPVDAPLDDIAIEELKSMILASGSPVADLVSLAGRPRPSSGAATSAAARTVPASGCSPGKAGASTSRIG